MDTYKMHEQINALTHEQMGRFYRFAPIGHPFFERNAYPIFMVRFTSLGGMTPELSKKIGWVDGQKT